MPAEASPAACPNCAQAFDSPAPHYCPACGQETRVRPPRIGEFIQQFGGAYLSTEGALCRTLKLLLLKPGELTRQYLAGRRKHYVLPLRLYLTISVVTLLLVRALAAANMDIGPTVRINGEATEPAELHSSFNLSMAGGRAGLKDGHFYCTDLPGWICKRLKKRMDIDPKAIGSEIAAFSQRFMANLGGVMFLMLPSFALWLKLAYWNRRLHYTEHLVFALHTHAFLFVMLALTLPQWPWLSALAFTACPVYVLLAMRRVYGGRWWPLWLRAMMVGTLYSLTLVVALGLMAVWTLLF